MNIQIEELQNQILLAVSKSIEYEWEIFVINLEVTYGSSGGAIIDSSCYFIYKSGTELKNECYFMATEIENLFLRLRKEMKENSSDQWDICDLTSHRSGKFEFRFSYDGPKRLANIFDFESMWRFSNHMEDYQRRMQQLNLEHLLKKKNWWEFWK